jgi:hypothetical protein
MTEIVVSPLFDTQASSRRPAAAPSTEAVADASAGPDRAGWPLQPAKAARHANEKTTTASQTAKRTTTR